MTKTLLLLLCIISVVYQQSLDIVSKENITLADFGKYSSPDYGFIFYNLCLSHNVSNKQLLNTRSTISKVHLIRVPKSSSSSLSAVARRIVGCEPPGPCCRYPGDPKGSCPIRALFDCHKQQRVIGCTDHSPFAFLIPDKHIDSISMVREPFSRSVSGFFYPGIHHNSNCVSDIDTCFIEYAKDLKWKNILVKMLSGAHAYASKQTCNVTTTGCKHSLEIAINNINKMTFIGIAEMWELSMLVMFKKMQRLKPLLSEFRMGKEYVSVNGTYGESSVFIYLCSTNTITYFC